ncbi:unnamed protein product [Blumeria hordei]|uniref:Uncharacterized protein n=1 Tax=Blumeria hordei TaxID=2867405 RepID=A0A383UIJ8_BLUHO|nr:unnamed protein product [Blumeria hordei]
MTSDTSLYGIQKSKKVQKHISSSSSLAFTSTLSSLLSTSALPAAGTSRTRPSKYKSDTFTYHKKNPLNRKIEVKKEGVRGNEGHGSTVATLNIEAVDDATLHRSQRRLKAKAKIYSQIKRGELVENEEMLVDFDQKWAKEGDAESSSDVESDDGHGEMVEYEDEFGRARRGTRSEVERLERRKHSALVGAEDLVQMSARPAMPSKLIYGDAVQSLAFNPDEPIVAKMEELAAKRDRSLTPPEMRHYEADKEIRTKGVGFYSFSKNETVRQDEMKALERERLVTEKCREERKETKARRLKEIEERRRMIRGKRAIKQGNSFLDLLGDELGLGK